MRRPPLVLLLLLVFSLTCTSTRSLPRGVVYVSEDGSREIRAHSVRELDLRVDDERYLGRYTIEGNRVRVVVMVEGSERVLYYTLDEEGLLGDDRVTLLAVEPGAGRELVDHRRAQRETMKTLREVGTALFAWLTDEVGGAAAGAAVTTSGYPEIGVDELEEILVPTYIRYLPREDGWGHPLDFRLAVDDLLAKQVMMLRSPGADGRFDGDSYEVGPFDPREIDHDIVWADGYFATWPEVDRGDDG